MVQNFHLTIDWKKIYLLILLNFGVTIFGKVGGGGGVKVGLLLSFGVRNHREPAKSNA